MASFRPRDAETRIKAAAIASVAEGGLAGLEVRAICARAAVSEAALRRCWPDAWSAFLEAFDERSRLPSLPDTGSLSDDLFVYARDYRLHCADRSYIALMFYLMGQAGSDPDVQRRLGPGFVDRRRHNLTVIRRAVARGELPEDVDGNAILDAVFNMNLSWMGRDVVPSEPEIRCAIDALIATAKAPGPRRGRSPAQSPAPGAYRLFLINPGTQARRLAEFEPLRARSERRAITEADARRGGRHAELWKGDRLIRVFDAD